MTADVSPKVGCGRNERPSVTIATGRASLGFIALLALLTGTAVATAFLWARSEPAPGRIAATISVTGALRADGVRGYARATSPREFSFPRDHGPHPEFRTEWWYYTGNVRTRDGRHFGFQLTFFRNALHPEPVARDSEWGATQVYLAHFALTDTNRGRFVAFARSSRDALGLAGARAKPFRVWLEDWSVEGEASSALPMRLRAAEAGTAIDLVLESAKPVVLQGERGLSRKGPEPGNASYYYSLTRMPARGTVRVDSEAFDVDGFAWMDREWSTSALSKDLVGWDWFALQLDDGRDVMFYQLRRADGSGDRFGAGMLVEADGTAQPLRHDEIRIDVLATWRSPRSGVLYPARWRLTLPSRNLELDLSPRVADQELIVGTRYWEGAVTAQGMANDRRLDGQGYVELVGYGETGRNGS